MKIPKIDIQPRKTSIEYPHVSTWDVMKEYLKLMKLYHLRACFVAVAITISTIAEAVFIPLYYKDFFDNLASISHDTVRNIETLIPLIILILIFNVIKWLGYRYAWFSTIKLEASVMENTFRTSFDYLIKPHTKT